VGRDDPAALRAPDARASARERVLVLWRALAAGDFGEVERNEWRDGYGDEPSA